MSYNLTKDVLRKRSVSQLLLALKSLEFSFYG